MLLFFIKLEEYNDVTAIVEVVKKKLEETKETLIQLKQLRMEEAQEIDAWEQNLKEIHEKIEFADEILKEPRF